MTDSVHEVGFDTGFATLTYKSGRKRVLTVHVDFSDGSKWATTSRRNADTGYSLYADGTVAKERYGTGRNAGFCLWSEVVEGATWEVTR
jgi:hypothetical protein